MRGFDCNICYAYNELCPKCSGVDVRHWWQMDGWTPDAKPAADWHGFDLNPLHLRVLDEGANEEEVRNCVLSLQPKLLICHSKSPVLHFARSLDFPVVTDLATPANVEVSFVSGEKAVIGQCDYWHK